MSRAAYQGFADTIRLLLFRDACQGRQDKDGMASQRLISNTFFISSPIMYYLYH